MEKYSGSIFRLFTTAYENRHLLRMMIYREVIGKYRGSMLGVAWSLFTPLIMLVIYTFVFSVIFRAKWGVGEGGSKTDFAIILFVGIIIHAIFAECINRAPLLIVDNINYVKKVIFPIEIFPWVALGVSLFHASMSLVVLLVFQFIVTGSIQVTAPLFIIVLLPLLLITIGCAWVFAAAGVFLRDISQTVGLFTTALLFLSPIFYPVSALPRDLQFWLYVNPLTYFIEESRKVLVYGQQPDWALWLLYSGIGLLVAWIGFYFFQKARKGFADVL